MNGEQTQSKVETLNGETIAAPVQSIVRPFVVSFGGGVNSTALLVGLYERGEKPDAILFADTGGEKPETYEHVHQMRAWLIRHEMPDVTMVCEPKTLEADCLDRETLPGKAFGFGSCSEHFKVRPQRKWLKQQGWPDVVWLVGIHAGEEKRAQRTLNQRTDVRFPLIEWGWTQTDCEAALDRHGIPVPVKSACFFCPAMRKPEVIQLSKTHPELFARAVEMEQSANDAGNLQTVKGLGRHWRWEALVKADEAQLRLFEDTQAPICDVCVDW